MIKSVDCYINGICNTALVIDGVATHNMEFDADFHIETIKWMYFDSILFESKENIDLPKNSILTLKLKVDVEISG